MTHAERYLAQAGEICRAVDAAVVERLAEALVDLRRPLDPIGVRQYLGEVVEVVVARAQVDRSREVEGEGAGAAARH